MRTRRKELLTSTWACDIYIYIYIYIYNNNNNNNNNIMHTHTQEGATDVDLGMRVRFVHGPEVCMLVCVRV